ncbi:DegT/DnrJ/EryC1/StrS family aminotransferase [Alphaproteobacteria bacterium LSUCC0684]
MTNPDIPLIDLASQQVRIRDRVDAAVARVLDHGQYIMGPEVGALEEALAAFCSCRHVISCSSGTDALMLGLMALGVRPGDGVIVQSFTFAASAEVLPCLGAVPVFADVDPVTFNLSPGSVASAKAAADKAGIRVVGIITVGLFGQPADMDAITDLAEKEGWWVLDDAAQSFGASYKGRPVGTLAPLTATSFFPAKPLGCYGDGGAVFTDDDDFAAIMRSARIHGMGQERYSHERIGMTARLDTIQAAILLEKLEIFEDELASRQQIADRYEAGLSDIITAPRLAAGNSSSWAQYTITLAPGADRGEVQAALKDKGIPTAIYYPKGMHQQPPYEMYPVAGNGLPVTEDLCGRVLALPMHPYLDAATQDYIITTLREVLA